MVGFGGAYALAQLGCGMGPLLALIGTGMASEPPLGTMGVFGAFALGSTTMSVMLAASTGLMSDVLVGTLRGILPAVNRISGQPSAGTPLRSTYLGGKHDASVACVHASEASPRSKQIRRSHRSGHHLDPADYTDADICHIPSAPQWHAPKRSVGS